MKKWSKVDKDKELKKLKIPKKRKPFKKDYSNDEDNLLVSKNVDWVDLKSKQAK